MFKKSKSSKKKTIKGREDAAADEMYFSCSESFDDAGEEAKGINRRFSFGNNKKKELANVQRFFHGHYSFQVVDVNFRNLFDKN